jgi:K+-sensing histidine kinase KdpD
MRAGVKTLLHWRVPLLGDYLAAAALVGLLTVVSALSVAVLQTTGFLVAFPVGLVVALIRFGVGPAVVAAAGGVLAFDFVFVPPAMAFAIPDRKDALTLVVMLGVAALAGVLAERLRRQARSAQRQAEVEGLRNALLSCLSHDLRTPLATLVGAGNALHEDRLDPLERREFSRMIAEEAGRLNRLVGNLLELTRLESGALSAKPTPQAIDEVIGSAMCRLERQLQGRPIRTDVPEATPLTSYDPVLMEQVFVNVLENVIHHTPEASPVEIRVRSHDGEILVEVADSGPGVRAGDEERVFQRLYRADPGSDGGVGLGLTICRAIMTAHDGRIWLENGPGGGAVVRLALPIRRASRVSHHRLPPALSDIPP